MSTGPQPRPKRPSERQRDTLTQVSRHEFLFYKGYLLGADLRKLGQTYLPPGVLPSAAVRTIRDHLVMGAHRAGRLDVARFVRIHVAAGAALPEGAASERPEPAAPALPTLDAYRVEKDPSGDFYSEAELVKLFMADYPQARQLARRTQRNRRLRERQLAALDFIERLMVRVPTRADAVGAWFEPSLAARLAAGAMATLDDLIDRVQTQGHGWWSEVPRLGAKAAERIHAWLAHNGEALAYPSTPHTVAPRGSRDVAALHAALGRTTGIVPIERFQLPSDLNGAHGWNRGPRDRNMTGADDDYTAIQRWLAARGSSAHTTRAYRKEAERVLAWAILERGKALSSLIVADGVAYRDWLAAFGRTDAAAWPWRLPQSGWIGPRGTERSSPAWRPFDGPLSERSQQQARVIVQALFQWLTDQCYLIANPWKGVGRAAPTNTMTDNPDAIDHDVLNAYSAAIDIRDRTLSPSQWQSVLDYAALPDDLARERLRFILMFAYGTGLRASELVTAATGALRHYVGEDDEPYDQLVVRGKGRRIRTVPMPLPVMSALSAYLVKRGLDPNPYAVSRYTRLIGLLRAKKVSQAEKNKQTALLEAGLGLNASVPPDKLEPGLSADGLYRLLKDCFAGVAVMLKDAGKPDDARKLAAASTHWLRHTCGSHAVAAGVSIDTVRENFGHASVNTTTLYLTQPIDARFAQMRAFMKKWE